MRFECDYPDCNRSYLRKEHLSRHQRNHANLRSFACALCSATFNRSDLLHRHEALNHGQTAPPSLAPADEDRDGASKAPGDPAEVLPRIRESAEPTYLDLSGKSPSQLLEDSDRAELQDLYFSRFHQEWPILDKDDYYGTPQTASLVQSVLVIGLYMRNTPEAEVLAFKYHEVLIKSAVHFFAVIMPLVSSTSAPRLDLLPEIQTLMLPVILSLYRGGDGAYFLQVLLCNKHLFTLFEQVGVYDQRRIDAEVSSQTHREQYQRLALMHFKLHLHVNALIVTKHAQFKPSRSLTPSMINVRVPVLGRADENGNPRPASSLLVGSLFAEGADPSSFRDISEVVAWDFALGMALGCYLAREPDETEAALMHRMNPYLILR